MNNVLVAQPKSGKWRIQFDLKVGDIGLCVVNDSDLSIYKQDGNNDFLVSTDRNHDLNDSIFLPLSLYTQDGTSGLNFIISDSENQNFIKFNNGNLNIQSKELTILKNKLITIQSAQTTLKQILTNLGNILTGANTQTASNHTHATFDGTAKSAINGWVSSLDTLFKD